MANDWEKFTTMVKEKWSKLNDADLTTFGGSGAQLSGLLQKKYGYSREQADQEIDDFSSAPKS